MSNTKFWGVKLPKTGLLLITLVLVIPGLDGIFDVQTLTWQIFIVYGFAFASFILVQLEKIIRSKFLNK